MTVGPPVKTIRQFTKPALMELVSFLQPWFQDRKGGGAGAAPHDLLVLVDGLGSPPSTGFACDVRLDFACQIIGWTLLADTAGSVEIDVWKDTYANFPPTVGDSITGGNPPFITAAAKNTDDVLTGWTTSIDEGDCLRFNVDSVATMTQFTLALHLDG